jgi:hypothetical protein
VSLNEQRCRRSNMSKAKFLSGALLLAALFTTRALAVGSDVAHHSTLEANTGAYGCASSMAKRRLTCRHPYPACVIGVVRAAE